MKHFFNKNQLVLSLVALLFSACYTERYLYEDESFKDITPQEVASARQWYYANVKELSLKSEGNSELQLNMQPRWKDAVVKSTTATARVEMPVSSPGSFHLMNEESRSKFEAGDKRYATSLTRLVIETNRNTGRQIGFLMTISPSAECLEKTDFNPFDKLWYRDVPDIFSGHIIYHNLSGKFVNGWLYENGKIKYSIRRSSSNNNNNNTPPSLN
jgi:hypothetical protein